MKKLLMDILFLDECILSLLDLIDLPEPPTRNIELLGILCRHKTSLGHLLSHRPIQNRVGPSEIW